jgi:hypothetical protein
MHKPPPPPKPALVVPAEDYDPRAYPSRARDESRRLAHFIAIALALGLLGIIIVAVLASRGS